MSSKIDVRDLVRDHMATLVDRRTGKSSKLDLAVFFVLPLAVASVLALRDWTLSHEASSILITALSIFAGLLFNLLVLVHGLIRREDPLRQADERVLVKQIYANISYATLVSLSALLPLVGQALWDSGGWPGRVLSFIGYFLIGNFLLTLYMILKRVHTLLGNEFSRGVG